MDEDMLKSVKASMGKDCIPLPVPEKGCNIPLC